MVHLRQRDRGDGQQPLSRENGRTVCRYCNYTVVLPERIRLSKQERQ